MSRISFGCANFGGVGSAGNLVGKGDTEKECHHILNTAYAHGVNHFDTASTYGAGNSEKILGRWIKKYKIPRDKVVISSKIGGTVSHFFSLKKKRGLSREHINRELDLSLKRLKLDYLDILYIHMPDPNTSLEETLHALTVAVCRGKVRKIGASNIDVDYLKQSLMISRENSLAEFDVIQNEYNFINRKDERILIPYCQEENILYIAYGPLSGGILSGKYTKGIEFPINTRLYLRPELYNSILTEDTFSTVESLNKLAEKYGVALSTLIYSWLYKRSAVSAFLIGVRNAFQFKSVTDALHVNIPDSCWFEMDSLAVRFGSII